MIDALREHVLGLDPLYFDAKKYEKEDQRFYTTPIGIPHTGMKATRVDSDHVSFNFSSYGKKAIQARKRWGEE